MIALDRSHNYHFKTTVGKKNKSYTCNNDVVSFFLYCLKSTNLTDGQTASLFTAFLYALFLLQIIM